MPNIIDADNVGGDMDTTGIVSQPGRRHRPLWAAAAGLVMAVLLAVLLAVVLAMLWPPSPAAAHANLLGSDPANGAVLAAPPAQVTLTFSEPVRLVPDRVLVVGPDGARVDAGEPRADGTDITIPLGAGADAEGTYLVSYRVISQDSHPIAGGITYSVGTPSPEPPELVVEDLTDPAVATAVKVNRYLGYVGLSLVVGMVVMLALLWPHRLPRAAPARLLWIGMGLLALSALAGLWLQAPYTTGGSLAELSGAALRDVLSSTYGTAHVVRLGVLVAAAVLLRPLLAGRAGPADLVLLAGLGVIGLGTWAFSGHPVASPLPAISVVVQMVHLAAAAFWIGGLVALFAFLLRLANPRELGVILPTWSRWAALAVVALMLAGVIQAVIEVGVPEALVTTAYGRLLLAKIGLFAVVVAVAGVSRKLVRDRTAADRPGPLRRAVVAEAVLLAVVLVVTSVLVQTTPGRTEAANEGIVAVNDFAATLESQLYSLQVVVEPGQQGSNTVHLYAYTLEGEELAVEEWGATAALPAADIEPIDIPLLPLLDYHATGLVTLPVAGDWEFRFTLRLSEIDQASVAATVPIR